MKARPWVAAGEADMAEDNMNEVVVHVVGPDGRVARCLAGMFPGGSREEIRAGLMRYVEAECAQQGSRDAAVLVARGTSTGVLLMVVVVEGGTVMVQEYGGTAARVREFVRRLSEARRPSERGWLRRALGRGR